MNRLLRVGGVTGLVVTTAALVLWGCDDPNRPQAAMEVRVSPDSVHVAKGEVASMHSVVLGRDGTELPEWPPEADWSIGPQSVAEILEVDEEGRVTIRAIDLGTAEVVAAVERRSGEGRVHVHPAGLHSLEIEPSTVVTSVGMATHPRVRLLDAEGDELEPTGFRISWQVADTTVARLPIQAVVGARYSIPVTGLIAGRETILRALVNGQSVETTLRVIAEPIQPAPPAAAATTPGGGSE